MKKERDAVRSQIGFLALEHERKPTAAEFAAVIDTYDEFLVHEKYDSQKVFGLMGRFGATNQVIAKAYSQVVAKGLTIKFGDTTVSDQLAEMQRQKLEKLTIAYYDKIDAAMAAPAPAATAPTTPAPVAPTTAAPATTAPTKTPKK